MMSYVAAEGIPTPSMRTMWICAMRIHRPMGIAADIIATEEGFSREELDRFSAMSQQRARPRGGCLIVA